jgi:hypothetical protein
MGGTEDAGVPVSDSRAGAGCCICCVGCTGCICWKNDEGPRVSVSTPGIEGDEAEEDEGEAADEGIDEDAGTVGADAWLGAAGRTITSRTRTRKGGRHARSDSTSSHCDCGFFKPIAMRVRLATTVPLSLRSGWSIRKPLGIGVSDS